MARFEIECPRCKEDLVFRAQEGDALDCAECGLTSFAWTVDQINRAT